MSLTLHYHPLSSYCMKALVGLYELGVPHDKHLVDLGDADARAAFAELTFLGKFPVLRDHGAERTVLESSILLEYVDARCARAGARLLPTDPERALACRFHDRFFDQYVHTPMQTIVHDKLRPEGAHDPFGVERAKGQLARAYAIVENELRPRVWAVGEDFTLADCAAAPALFYADKVVPIGEAHPRTAAYLARLVARPSFARVLEEAAPYFAMFPG